MVPYEFILGRKINPIMGQPNSIWSERAAKGQCKSINALAFTLLLCPVAAHHYWIISGEWRSDTTGKARLNKCNKRALSVWYQLSI